MAYEREIPQTIGRLRPDVEVSGYHMTLMALAGILAAVGLLTNSVPVLIGAMLVAPAFAPLALLALAIVLGRWPLAVHSLKVSVVGLIVAVASAILTTAFVNALGIIPVEANLVQRELLEERVRPGWYSMAAALAAGSAGMLAEIRNKTDTLVGTVASVALVPAGGAAGIAFLSGDAARAAGGLILLAINVILIVVTGMMVLLAIGRGRRRSRRPAGSHAPTPRRVT